MTRCTVDALKPFVDLPIDWDLTPEHAVTMYLEWGNNDWNSQYGPVRSKKDVSFYFVVDSWGEVPLVRLVRRNSEMAEDLVSFPLPAHLMEAYLQDQGTLKGIAAPIEPIKEWLRQEMEQ